MTDFSFRPARPADLPAIVAMLADDGWGRDREIPTLPLDPRYVAAFAEIEASADQMLVVADDGGLVVGTLQLTFIRNFSHLGSLCGQIEGVRVASDRRGTGLGGQLIGWAVDTCRHRGCATVQLTTTNARVDAQRFYKRLGFTASHTGMKRAL